MSNSLGARSSSSAALSKNSRPFRVKASRISPASLARSAMVGDYAFGFEDCNRRQGAASKRAERTVGASYWLGRGHSTRTQSVFDRTLARRTGWPEAPAASIGSRAVVGGKRVVPSLSARIPRQLCSPSQLPRRQFSITSGCPASRMNE